jgi:hypothetical protein
MTSQEKAIFEDRTKRKLQDHRRELDALLEAELDDELDESVERDNHDVLEDSDDLELAVNSESASPSHVIRSETLDMISDAQRQQRRGEERQTRSDERLVISDAEYSQMRSEQRLIPETLVTISDAQNQQRRAESSQTRSEQRLERLDACEERIIRLQSRTLQRILGLHGRLRDAMYVTQDVGRRRRGGRGDGTTIVADQCTQTFDRDAFDEVYFYGDDFHGEMEKR